MLKIVKSYVLHAVALARYALRDYPVDTMRSPKWRGLRDVFVSGQICAACGGTTMLDVHHIIPYHLAPELELDDKNFIVLCMERDRHCHLVFGHGGEFMAYNPHVVMDAEAARSALRLEDDEGLRLVRLSTRSSRRYERGEPVEER
jgi:5-methylcytosine-specific restriction protein A